jgi:hypothetical protein
MDKYIFDRMIGDRDFAFDIRGSILRDEEYCRPGELGRVTADQFSAGLFLRDTHPIVRNYAHKNAPDYRIYGWTLIGLGCG